MPRCFDNFIETCILRLPAQNLPFEASLIEDFIGMGTDVTGAADDEDFSAFASSIHARFWRWTFLIRAIYAA
ncbi:MAG: hypothetical protein NTX36_14700 [Proteobacteria bacterium]|nr:hypothetical protein [Pseudomonadota bacterium]